MNQLILVLLDVIRKHLDDIQREVVKDASMVAEESAGRYNSQPRIEGMTPEMSAKVTDLVARGICLRCGKPIGGVQEQRGCHVSCNRNLRDEIKAGLYTEEQVIAKGWRLPKKKPGRKPHGERDD